MFGRSGWHDGAEECDPPEPYKEWLSIGPLEPDGSLVEELAIVVLRKGHEDLRAGREYDADYIVRALNSLVRADEAG